MDQADDLYRIGTVAKLTGIAVERLRAWERRYDLAPASKIGKTRFYSSEQVGWLKSVKALIDQGQPISSLVDLNQAQLDARLTTERKVRTRTESARVALIGTSLLLLEQEQQDAPRLSVISRSVNVDAYLELYGDEPAAELTPDVILVQVPVLTITPLEQLQDTAPDAQMLVFYEFARPTHLQAATAQQFELLSWPQSWSSIEQAAANVCGLPLLSAQSAQRRFTDEELVAIAGSSSDPHQCPRHLTEMITRLNAFAEFTAALAAASETAATQAPSTAARPGRALYHRLHTNSTQARATLEQALELAIEAETLSPRVN